MLKLSIKKYLYFLLLVTFFCSGVANAKSDKNIKANASISSNHAEVYEGPNAGKVLAIISRFTPILVLSKAGNFSKVTDVWGYTGWVSNLNISTTNKYVIAKGPVTPVFKSPQKSSAVVFEVTTAVALKVIASQGDWLKVEHYDKTKGFVAISNVRGY